MVAGIALAPEGSEVRVESGVGSRELNP
jgi:hypothetical protein